MNKIIYKIKLSSIIRTAFIVCYFCVANSTAQESYYPTPEQVKAKENTLEEMDWQTPIGKINPGSQLMVTGSMQDCSGGIPICAQSYTQSSSYTGYGPISEVPRSTCLKSGEKNSVWYIFSTQTAGNFGFVLSTAKDYDYALYDITTMGCSGIPSATPAVCNYSGFYGSTGMSATGSGYSQPPSGNAFCALLPVPAGKTYALIISNYTGDATGYTLTFPSTAGYASITDVNPPTINPPNAITNNCNNTFNITLSEPVKCSTISSNGSDFTISNGGAITAASGIGCGSNGLTDQIQITYTAPTSRTYTIGIKNGTDGNTLIDNCGNAMITSQTTTFNHLGAIGLTASVSAVCNSGTAITLTATGAKTGGTYTLSPGGISNTNGIFNVNPTATTTYIVSVTDGGCTKTASTTVTVISNIVATIDPINPTICSGSITLTASSSINGADCSNCTYSWAPGGATTKTITATSGTYTVTVSKPGASCTGAATSTVTLVSGVSSNCNVIYVSPTGTGEGISPGDPTSINAALTSAVCSGAIIKMQTGIYNISNKLVVSSYVTLEGGYNSTFTTKTSDMSSGNATTIVRNATPDGGSGLSVTAFEVSPSQTGFRFQDLRIEMAISAAGAQISNYGIKLGTNCTSYNIVRCYIDAGQGSSFAANDPGSADANAYYINSLSSNSRTINLTSRASYCNATYTNGCALVWIDNFSTTGGSTNITNNGSGCSGTGGYMYNSSMNVTVPISGSFNVSMQKGGNNSVGFRIWIDYNQDGDFADTGEDVFSSVVGTGVFTGSINIPGTASLGLTRMRVRDYYNATPATGDYCTTLSYGETEDYDITITALTPPGASYGIYAPGAVSGITDCEIYAQGGAGTAGCLVCSPTDAGYTNVNISSFPIITATNIACTNKSITLSTAASSPTWSGSSPISGSGASTNVTFTTTGRKNVTMTSGVSCPGAASTTVSPNSNIPDNSCPSGISSNVVVSGYTGCTINTANVTVKVNITHGNVYDLVLFLIAPNGKILSLAAHNSPGGGVNFTNTIFSDAGSTNISTGTAPYTNTYKPRGYIGTDCKTSNVATFAAIAGAGYNPNGTWTLFVSDGLPSVTGQLVNWTLNLPAASGGGSGASTYTGFTNMMMTPPSSGSITGTPNGCPGSYNYASSTRGTPGISYSWSISPTTGVSIASPTSSATNITFPNTSTTYTVTCTPTSGCCGVLTAVAYTTTINTSPVAPTAASADTTPCTGGSTVLTATAPANASYAWYDAASGGNLLGTGATYPIPSVTTGLITYYAEALNVAGCASTTRTAVNVTGTVTPTPISGGNLSRCGAGIFNLTINSPQPGYIYTWYTGSCGGTQIQSNTSSNYVASLSSSTTYYVNATAPGCSPSACVTITATINTSPSSLTWLGTASGANNWFNPANWAGGCLPSCVSDVSIPVTTYNPDIGFNAASGAACKSLNLQASTTISFSDSKAELSICGDFTHNGTFTSNNKGVILFIGTAAQTYTKTTGTGDLNSVVLNNTAGTPTLTLSGDMTLGSAGNFTFQSGKVITGANNLIIKNTENTSIDGHNVASYVEGNLRRYINSGATGSYDFPVGNSSKGYQLANINFTLAPSTISYLTANFQTYGSLPGALNLSDGPTTCAGTYNQSALNNGYWTISANTANNNSGLYDMTLYNRNYSNNYNGYTIMSMHNGSGSWGLLNGDGSVGNCVQSPITAVRRNNMKGFSSFGTTQGSNPLPIELLFFAAAYNNKLVDVTWSTASEKNNNYFTIERSQDAQHFIIIGKVPSKAIAGNSITTLNYLYKDMDVKPGVYYYRLKQTDFDGQYAYSAIATVTIDGKEDNNVMIVKPNPTLGKADIMYKCNNATYSQLSVLDSKGGLILSEKILSEKGDNKYTIDLSKQMDGIYYIMLSVEDKVYKSKILKNE